MFVFYVEFYVYSAFSFLDGVLLLDELVVVVVEFGYEVMVFIDYNGVLGLMEFVVVVVLFGLWVI